MPTAAAPLDLVCLGEAMVEFNQSRDDAMHCRAGFGGDSAGDRFAGMLHARLAAGDSLIDAARAANVAAALSTQGVGAVAPLPRCTQVQAVLASLA